MNLFNYLARVANSHHVGRDVFGHDRACTDGHVVADGDSRKDCDATAYPYIVADADRFSPFFAGIPFDRVSAVACCIDAYIRSNEAVVSDGDLGLVKDREMEIGKETLAYADLFAVIAVERLVDYDLVISNVSKQTFEYLHSAGVVCRGEIIIFVNHFLHGIEFL